MTRSWIASALLALAVFAPRVAFADDEIDPNTLRAEKVAAEADAKQSAGAYAEAVELYLEAYKAAPAAVLLFNIAKLYDAKLGARSLAVDYYQRALAAQDLDETLASEARSRIHSLGERDDGSAQKPPMPAASEERGWHPFKIVGAAAAGVGLLSLGTSGILALVAKSKDDDANAFCDGDRCTDARAIELTNDAQGLANAATVTFVIGAVLAAGGVVLWLVAPNEKKTALSAGGVRF